MALGVVDGAYDPDHRDLPPAETLESLYEDTGLSMEHGTEVLGMLCGSRDGVGVTGIAYDIGHIYFANYVDIPPGSAHCFDATGAAVPCAFESAVGDEYDRLLREARIMTALDDLALKLRDWPDGPVVMLLEVTAYEDPDSYTLERPVELNPDIRTYLRALAETDGITVIEPAGNDSKRLDDVDVPKSDDGSSAKLWGADMDDASDSLAVMVGAGKVPPEDLSAPGTWRTHEAITSYGTRVNCQGWGNKVVTASTDLTGTIIDGSAYTDGFSGTSSASAMVAGVAVCLQGARLGAGMDPLSPVELRALLADPDYGSPQPELDASSYPIGPLPDLGKLLTLCSDIFLRDHVGDTGEEPSSGTGVCWSPDIILRTVREFDPEAAFGAGAWEDGYLCQDAAAGSDNYVYIRLSNRGTYPDDARITVYWADPSTFLYPDDWHEIGVLEAEAILQDEQRVIPDPLVWEAGDLPAAGHYCLIALAETDSDKVDVAGALSAGEKFVMLVREQNNLCFRNIKVVEAAPGSETSSATFFLRGLPGRYFPDPDNRHRLVIRSRLPRGAVVHVDHTRLEVHGPHLAADGIGAPPQRGDRPREPLMLQGLLPHLIDGIVLEPDQKVPVTVRVALPPRTPPGRYLVAAEQYWRGKLLGRVNFEVRVRPTA